MSESRDDDRDIAVLARVAAGDIAAMRALYTEHADAARRFVRTRLSDEFEVADIVHETMLSVWRGANNFERRSTVRSWILSIARNKVIDHVRKQARVSLAEPDETTPDEDPDAEAVIAAAEDARRVRGCIEQLSDRQRAVVHLAFFEDLGYPEIAAIEGVPEGTVKTRIFHAKKLLMRCLSRPLEKD
jgi:RNA polymerase sigma-70 factor (ECF subfamily)